MEMVEKSAALYERYGETFPTSMWIPRSDQFAAHMVRFDLLGPIHFNVGERLIDCLNTQQQLILLFLIDSSR